jgi:glycerophosphoryl diester phosphodiesterase
MNRYFSQPRPVLFAHRGASAHAPENTLAAFFLALEHGADGIELDAKVSADGEVFVLHDATLIRTTGVAGKAVERTLNELKQLDAGSWKGESFAGERIPALREVFANLGGKLIINVELTNYGHGRDGLVEKVIALVREFHLEESVLFSSFTPANIKLARKLVPEIPAALLTWKGWLGGFFRSAWMMRISPQGLHPYWSDVTPQLMAREKQRGRFVNVWTVNDPAEMTRLFDLGVDGIFTDDPRLARQTLEGI